MTDFISPFEAIDGVKVANLRGFGDARGVFREIFRREWFPQADWTQLQSNCSESKANALRGLHYHRQQVDYWYVPAGRIRAALVDLRAGSPTFKASATLDMGDENPVGLFIPEGVAHGFAALTDCTLIYYVNNYYDGGKDEFGVAWDDPAFDLDWGVQTPLISERDQANPAFAQIAELP